MISPRGVRRSRRRGYLPCAAPGGGMRTADDGARATWPGATLLGVAALLAVVSQSCARPAPPRQVDDLCALLAERDGWRAAAHRARRALGGLAGRAARGDPPGVALPGRGAALVAAAGPRSRWHRPRPRTASGRPPTAPGATTGARPAAARARRDDFADAVDFVGWYADVIPSRDAGREGRRVPPLPRLPREAEGRIG